MSTSGAVEPHCVHMLHGRFPDPAPAPQRLQTPAQHLCGTKLVCSCSSKLRNPPVASLGAYVSAEMQLRTVTTCAPAGASWVLSGVSGFRATQRYRFQPETPFSRSAELDFGFLPGATPVGMRTCYPELQLSTSAANAVAQYLSCKTLPETLQNTTFCRKRSLEHLLPKPRQNCKTPSGVSNKPTPPTPTPTPQLTPNNRRP